MGTDSCYVVDPGDFSYKIAYSGRNFSWFSIAGDIEKGDSQIIFSFLHIYSNPGAYEVGFETLYCCCFEIV